MKGEEIHLREMGIQTAFADDGKSTEDFFSVKNLYEKFMGGAFSVFFREYGYGSYQEIEDQNRRRSSEA